MINYEGIRVSTRMQELCYSEIHVPLLRNCYWIIFNYYYFELNNAKN